MSSSSPPSSKPMLEVNPTKATSKMISSLSIIRESILCPLCNQIMNNASTLQCSHSFCNGCIENYTKNSWNCPLPGCNLPVSIRGTNKNSYIATNPNLSTIITSFENIVSALNSARPEWWKMNGNDNSNSNGDDENQARKRPKLNEKTNQSKNQKDHNEKIDIEFNTDTITEHEEGEKADAESVATEQYETQPFGEGLDVDGDAADDDSTTCSSQNLNIDDSTWLHSSQPSPEQKLNKSCAIPESGPNLSPIILLESQQSHKESTPTPPSTKKILEDFDEDDELYQNTKQDTMKEKIPVENSNTIKRKNKSLSFDHLFKRLVKQLEESPIEAQVSSNTGLLEEYCIFIHGNFDENNKDINALDSFTKSSIYILLNLCGAKVQDLSQHYDTYKSSSIQQRRKTCIILTLGNESKYDRKSKTNLSQFVRHVQEKLKSGNDIHVVSCDWLFDSIEEFKVKNVENYVYHFNEQK